MASTSLQYSVNYCRVDSVSTEWC